MSISLQDFLDWLPEDERKAIEVRASDLIAAEIDARKGRTNLTIRWSNRATNQKHSIEIPNDMVEIQVPALPSNGQHSIYITVYTDGFLIDTSEGNKVSMHTYADALSEAGMLEDIPNDETEDDGGYIEVEYDTSYSGGDYTEVGVMVRIPVKDIRFIRDFDKAVREAFQKQTGIDPVHIVSFSDEVKFDEENPDTP